MCGHGRTFFKILSGEPFLFFSQKNEKIPRFSLRNVCDLMIKKRNGFCLSGKKKTDTRLVTWRKKLQSFSDSDSESHSDPDFVQVEGWCVYVRETRQGPRNKTSQEHDLEVYLTQQVRPQWVSRSPPPVITEVHSQCYWYVWHITRNWYRQMQKYDISSSTQKNEVVNTGVCTSLRIGLDWLCNHSRNCSSLTRTLYTFLYNMTRSVLAWLDTNLVSTLFSITSPYCIFLSLMSCWTITWNRPNDFCLRAIQVTILVTLSKQSRKKGSISEAVASPMTLTCIRMDSVEDPTFFKKTSKPCDVHTKHYTQGNSFWISTNPP